MNKRDYIKREAEGVSKRHEIEYAVNWAFDFDAINEDRIEELRQERMWQKRRSRNLSCSDGFCGAEDCPKCRPGSYRFATEEED